MYSTTDILWKYKHFFLRNQRKSCKKFPQEKSMPPGMGRISSESEHRGDTKYERFLSPPEADIKPWLAWSLSIDTISPTALYRQLCVHPRPHSRVFIFVSQHGQLKLRILLLQFPSSHLLLRWRMLMMRHFTCSISFLYRIGVYILNRHCIFLFIILVILWIECVLG
jgi:hypothetical protein